MSDKSLSDVPNLLIKPLRKIFGGTASSVFKGMAVLAVGSGIARVVGIAAIPVLTRLYSPEDFGALSVFSALISIISPLLTLRYVLAIPLPNHDGMAFNLLVFSSGIMLGFMLLISALLLVFGEHVLAIFSMEILAPWWWLISIALLTSASYEMMTLWATRQRNYRIIARTNIWQSVIGSLVKILFGLMAIKPGGLLLGQVFANGGGSGSLFRAHGVEFKKNLKFLRWSRMKKVGWRYRDFPFFRVPSQFFLALSSSAPLLFMAVLYDAQTTGQLGLALMALGLPLQLFGRTLAKAFYAEAANLGRKNPGKIRSMARAVIKRLLLFSILPAAVLFFFGPVLFSLVFGHEWELSGTFASILSVYLVAQFSQTPVAHVFYIFDGQKQLLLLNFQRLLILLACFGSSYLLNLEAETAIWIYAISLSLHYFLSVWYAMRFISRQ
ncbi:lipopolysaccharide biosynthesis protein [Halomonas sp. 328]|uniref:lipopolysaccharide biosynthesis protein n=1 Tax=Halomonas sp. 328 TaxID=2776704 RepID=UPI0018A73876|nr:lipopolysaccharide biosynthesis protein [Halomonas sp. 328]MBF8224516.1 lipopolysaccharide biosynthesis protein [Halomonas sp. 328]